MERPVRTLGPSRNWIPVSRCLDSLLSRPRLPVLWLDDALSYQTGDSGYDSHCSQRYRLHSGEDDPRLRALSEVTRLSFPNVKHKARPTVSLQSMQDGGWYYGKSFEFGGGSAVALHALVRCLFRASGSRGRISLSSAAEKTPSDTPSGSAVQPPDQVPSGSCTLHTHNEAIPYGGQTEIP